MSENNQSNKTTVLRQLFGDNRAEWRSSEFGRLFVTPTYQSKLEANKPCFLIGGRGTGKTTALQSIRFDAMNARLESEGLQFSDQKCLGILVRMNKNRVHAFSGGGLVDQAWGKFFSHYFNLLICQELCELSTWLEKKTYISLSEIEISLVAASLGFSDISDLVDLKLSIKREISKLQIQVNNPSRDQDLILSMAEAPVREFADVLNLSGQLGDRVIFCCIDEYENLLDYQQALINTYIKHAEPPLSYKVGVRKNGIRNRKTLDAEDLLKTPDDFAEIEIADEGFEYFARAVAELRLQRAHDLGINIPIRLRDFLEELSLEEEAIKLGSEKIANQVLGELKEHDEDLYRYFFNKPSSETYFLKYWSESEGRPIVELARDWMRNGGEWLTRLGNYMYASLFWISKGNKGIRIRKYYSGERTLLAMSSGNIRYFLELLDSAIENELRDGDLGNKLLRISAKSQTISARTVGERRLNQLEGLADYGVQLKRLVLAIGKVLFERARSPGGKTPEVISFVLSGSGDKVQQLTRFLADGVAHLAFEVSPRTKATSNSELKDDEYRLHPIFSAFFEISHRRKRRMMLDAATLLAVLEDRPGKAISALLDGKEQSPEQELPEQLALFSSFYSGGQ